MRLGGPRDDNFLRGLPPCASHAATQVIEAGNRSHLTTSMVEFLSGSKIAG
jgi:hypothetical protein